MTKEHDGGVRIGVDIGGTFTDVAMETAGRWFTTKVLTTTNAPEEGVMLALRSVLADANVEPQDIRVVVHGTTLATNALIERKGARIAFITTKGFRDTLVLRQESRFDQYDLMIDLPEALVPRKLRMTVRERMAANGDVIEPLDDRAVERLIPNLQRAEVEAVAVGLLHSYANPAHERRIGALLARELPSMAISLSSEVSPEIREYERFSTVCANAYVQPLMARYLGSLETEIRALGLTCPLYMMLSGGGVTTVDTARRFPVRLVESGPAGGAVFSSRVAQECGLSEVISFDMGGTTAKLCLIDGGKPQTSRSFEVARVWRFKKGSGLPLRIPVIEMVEIGAGGGSIASIDGLGRVAVGPHSAGSTPGPACYGQGGVEPTVTDADLVLGRIDPARFSDGKIALNRDAAVRALDDRIGAPLSLPVPFAGAAVSEMVDENMANATRVHAAESGKDLRDRTIIAFGGAAPLHVARVAEKLGVTRFIVPVGAGVGSAVGFLRAPVAYEVVRSAYQRLDSFDHELIARHFTEMYAEAEAVVRPGAVGAPLVATRLAYMRYVGQGHEIAVPLHDGPIDATLVAQLRQAFDASYARLYSRTVPNVEIEALTWTLVLSTQLESAVPRPPMTATRAAQRVGVTTIFDPSLRQELEASVYWRPSLSPGDVVEGPAVIAEPETSTVITPDFLATVDTLGYLNCVRREI